MIRATLSLATTAGIALALCGPAGLAAEPTQSWGFALENGDANGDEQRDLSDGIYILGHLFLGGPAPLPLAHCGVAPPPPVVAVRLDHLFPRESEKPSVESDRRRGEVLR